MTIDAPTTTPPVTTAPVTTPAVVTTPTDGSAPYTIGPNQVNTGTQNSPLIVTGDAAAATHATNSADLDKILTAINTGVPVNGSLTGATTADTTAKINDASTAVNTVNDPSYSDPYTQTLDQMLSTSNTSTANIIGGIKTNLQNQTNQVNDSFDRYSRGLQLLGIENNSAQATPNLFLGSQYQAQQDNLKKLNDLHTAEQTAIMDAENARQNNNLQLMTEKMNYVKQLRSEKAATLKDLQATQRQNLSDYNSIATEIAPAVYNAINTPGLTDDQKQQILTAVSQKYGGIPLDMLVSEVAKTKAAGDKVAYDQGQDKIKNAAASAKEAFYEKDQLQKNAIAASKKTSGGSSTASKKTAIDNITAHLNNRTANSSGYAVRGSDNYVDPNEYLDLYKQWSTAGFSDKDWATQFPPKDYINPASYAELPKNLQPAKASATSGRKS